MPEASDLLSAVIRRVAARPGCRALPPAGQPTVAGAAVPEDLQQFYGHCGGLFLFEGSAYPWRVSGPAELVAAGPRLMTPADAARVAAEYPEDVTNDCYVVADAGRGTSTEAHVVIDLNPQRAGRCYEVSWDTYGLAGDMPVVARTMIELLMWLLATDPDTGTTPPARYGDAYDG